MPSPSKSVRFHKDSLPVPLRSLFLCELVLCLFLFDAELSCGSQQT
jgi:hypothetical protein